ncbi:MAG: protein kinase [Verrucomicrobiales bacterium]
MNKPTKDIEEIFHQAGERVPGDERGSFLDGACADDGALRKRVEALLRASETGDRYFEAPPPTRRVITESLGSSRISELIGGRYRLLERLGEGGMGEVYLAEQTEPMRRRVALKLIKLGMDSRQVIARFEAERQALALMNHPNIARVLDGGTTSDGRPFFVMDLVRGLPVTDYCDAMKLSVRDRLALFVQICHAVQHAHQKGVIHRDLKPTNILVSVHDGGATPVIIDFGIAKALQQQLTDRTVFTAVSQMMGTPAYMSPEQVEVNALDVDTRSDIYTLGVVLFELLCGSTPLRRERVKHATFNELQKLIREEDPPRPAARVAGESPVEQHHIADRRLLEVAALKRLIGAELGWITMKALEKDRQRRYATANALAADIERFLNGDPVEACPPRALYQFQKFVKKHRLPFAMFASAIVALALGLVGSAWQAVRAFRAEEKWRTAREETLDQLRNARLYQARSTRKTLDAGRQFDSLAAIEEAAKIRSGRDLRNEAIAALALPDIRVLKHWDLEAFRKGPIAIDRQVERFARGTGDGEVDLFQLNDRSPVESLPPEVGASVKKLRFSPDGAFLAVGYKPATGPRYVKIWRLGDACELALTVPDAEGGAIDFTSQSAMVAVGGDDDSVHIFSLDDDKAAAIFTVKLPFWANDVEFRPDGLRFAVCGRASRDVLIYDAVSGDQLTALRHPHSVHALDWNSDGKFLATACSNFNAYLWDVSGVRPEAILREFRGHEAEVIKVAIHPNSRFLLPLVGTTKRMCGMLRTASFSSRWREGFQLSTTTVGDLYPHLLGCWNLTTHRPVSPCISMARKAINGLASHFHQRAKLSLPGPVRA